MTWLRLAGGSAGPDRTDPFSNGVEWATRHPPDRGGPQLPPDAAARVPPRLDHARQSFQATRPEETSPACPRNG